MALIYINDLKLRALIGANSWERNNKQEVVVNIVLEYDATKAAKSDKLKDALDYDALSKAVARTVANSRCYLVEKLGERLLDLLKKDKRIISAAVRLDKPQAVPQAKSISFEVGFTR